MKAKYIISLATALLAASLLAGCEGMLDPEGSGKGNVISFDAGIKLIRRDSPTKALNTATTFSAGDKFTVFGRRTGEGRNTRIFYKDDSEIPAENYQGVTVTREASKWTYSPPSYWYWVNESNYYDFIAVHPYTSPAERMMEDGVDIPGNMAVKSQYVIGTDDYDLLMAATRRSGHVSNRTAPVNLEFHHMLCAVKVVITNESSSKALTLTSISMDNLIQSAWAKMTIDSNGDPEYYWIDSQRTGASESLFSGSQTIPTTASAPSNTYATDFVLLIPGDLADTIDGSLPPEEGEENYAAKLAAYEGKVPHLNIGLTFTGAAPGYEPDPILLKDIQRSKYSTDDPIAVWQPGIRYTYYIDVRLDGGVIVRVVTTEWDEIEAETPGLLIVDE